MAQAWGKPYIIAPHGMLYPWSLNQKRAKKRLALALGYRAMLNRAAFIHVLNGDEREAVARLKLRSPMRILPNGMFESDIQSIASSPTLGERWPQWAGRPVILFLSRLHPGKGLNLLAEAFAQVTKEDAAAQLVVAGPDGPAKEPFEQRVRDLGIAERVHLIGPVYGQDKYALMAAATCFCLPSAHETFSMAITEALTCGTPVVISENCHFPEVAEAGAGRVVPLEAPAVAGGLLEILRDADLRQRMGEAGRQLVLSRFTWPAIARQTIEAYENSRRPAVGRGQ